MLTLNKGKDYDYQTLVMNSRKPYQVGVFHRLFSEMSQAVRLHLLTSLYFNRSPPYTFIYVYNQDSRAIHLPCSVTRSADRCS
jgi:hypothetical protein